MVQFGSISKAVGVGVVRCIRSLIGSRWEREACRRTARADLPDVSMFAADYIWRHFTLFCDTIDGAPVCDYNNPDDVFYQAIGGTSVATPSFAGIMLLETQYLAEQQGSASPVRIGKCGAPAL